MMSVNAFHEKAGVSQVGSFAFVLDKVYLSGRVGPDAMLSSALSEERSGRSVHVGRSRFSRCCHLIIALWFSSHLITSTIKLLWTRHAIGCST
jgi:hypothetical protein